MKSRNKAILIMFCILAIPWLYLASFYKSLPPNVPLHFDVNGQPNEYGTKTSFVLIILAMTAIAIGVFFLMRNIKKIDPKKNAQYNDSTYNKIGLGVVVFVSAIIVMVIMAVSGTMSNGRLFMPMLGIFFAFIGNVMYSVKPNYFVGIRLPWTLENEDNWRKTHQLAGKLWFGGGLAIAVCSLLLPNNYSAVILFPIVTLLVLIPVVYSFIQFRKNKLKN